MTSTTSKPKTLKIAYVEDNDMKAQAVVSALAEASPHDDHDFEVDVIDFAAATRLTLDDLNAIDVLLLDLGHRADDALSYARGGIDTAEDVIRIKQAMPIAVISGLGRTEALTQQLLDHGIRHSLVGDLGTADAIRRLVVDAYLDTHCRHTTWKTEEGIDQLRPIENEFDVRTLRADLEQHLNDVARDLADEACRTAVMNKTEADKVEAVREEAKRIYSSETFRWSLIQEFSKKSQGLLWDEASHLAVDADLRKRSIDAAADRMMPVMPRYYRTSKQFRRTDILKVVEVYFLPPAGGTERFPHPMVLANKLAPHEDR